MTSLVDRPFYSKFTWAYDTLMTCPSDVRRRCDFIVEQLARRGVAPSRLVRDAGCGTGAYSIELASRGYRVVGEDLSPDLISEARRKTSKMTLPIAFAVGDMLRDEPSKPFDAILCRGVLNDLTGDVDRKRAFRAFASSLRSGGVLVLDVREWETSARRKAEEPIFECSAETSQGRLWFRSETFLDHEKRLLVVRERHKLDKSESLNTADYRFVMRCWTVDELLSCLQDCGFRDVELFGSYDASVPVGATERLVAVASLAGIPLSYRPDSDRSPLLPE